MTLATALEFRRLNSGFSVAELSRRAGLAFTSTSHYLTGRREPSLTAFRRICRGLGVDPGDVIRELTPIDVADSPPVRKVGRPRKGDV